MATALVLSGAACSQAPIAPLPPAASESSAPSVVVTGHPWSFERRTAPDRTVVHDAEGRDLAVFTDGARTVVVEGPLRVFKEPSTTDAVVETTAWVRLAPEPWVKGAERASWFDPWLASVVGNESADVLAVAFEYVEGAPARMDNAGVRVAGDAAFGPLTSGGGGRDDGTDFLDYLGVPWAFGDVASPRQPMAERYGMVDCSGFVRLVFGYRSGYPLLGRNEPGDGIPRRAWAILSNGPGAQLLPDEGRPPSDLGVLQPGDLLFFEVDSGDPQLDHTGIYLGVDSQGKGRFISSRIRANGPTMGDLGGASTIGSKGMYSSGLRGARRL
ncbi:MAG: NlpC/P60 family protein [Propionibacteriaceae bacterium]